MTVKRTNNKNHQATTARAIALDIFLRIIQEKAYSHLLLNQTLQKTNLLSLDRGLVTELVYGTCSRLNTIDYFLSKFVQKPLSKLEQWVKCLLEISVYQLIYLDRIPDHAIVNEAVHIAKSRGHLGISNMINGVLRNMIRHRSELVVPTNLPVVKQLSLIYSHPEWLVEIWIRDYGLTWTEQICHANLISPKPSIRVNTLKISRNQLMEKFQSAGINVEKSQLSDAGIIVQDEGHLTGIPMYSEGFYTIQDQSSMLVAEIVDPQPGMKVLDCCAAPGGKTTHLAERMQDQGEVWACDLYAHKQKLIEQQAERLSLKSIRTIAEDARQLQTHFSISYFDRILLDAPCSGFGVIRRKPEIKWNRQPHDLDTIVKLQEELLSQVCELLKPGGILVYSTCTLGKKENQEIIQKFLINHPQFTPIALPNVVNERLNKQLNHFSDHQKNDINQCFVQILPNEYQSDGFFIARFMKNKHESNEGLC